MQNCVCTNCAPASILPRKASGDQPGAGSTGMSAAPIISGGRLPTLAARQDLAAVAQPGRERDQVARLQIEHRLCIRLIALGRIVAAQHQKVAHAERHRAQKVALQRDAIAIAAGELQDRLDALLDHDRGRRERAHMRVRTGAVGDVDRVGEAFQRAHFRHHVGARA